jgi:S-adenosylmethionine hydrolase
VLSTITLPNYRLSVVSSTFLGRDIMTPAAAHLASGVSPSALGPPTRQLNSLPATPLGGSPNPDEPCVIGIDHFGNAMLDIPVEHELTGEFQL